MQIPAASGGQSSTQAGIRAASHRSVRRSIWEVTLSWMRAALSKGCRVSDFTPPLSALFPFTCPTSTRFESFCKSMLSPPLLLSIDRWLRDPPSYGLIRALRVAFKVKRSDSTGMFSMKGLTSQPRPVGTLRDREIARHWMNVPA